PERRGPLQRDQLLGRLRPLLEGHIWFEGQAHLRDRVRPLGVSNQPDQRGHAGILHHQRLHLLLHPRPLSSLQQGFKYSVTLGLRQISGPVAFLPITSGRRADWAGRRSGPAAPSPWSASAPPSARPSGPPPRRAAGWWSRSSASSAPGDRS